MTKVGLIQETVAEGEPAFRAVTIGKQGAGRTAGEAIDALTSQLEDDEIDTLIVVRNLGPDQFFTAAQRQRLEHLMQSWRSARDAGTAFPAAEQAELEALIDAEVRAATERAAAIARELGS
ncbi:MAG: hypothetical protein ACP5XB_01275 [Isosphaeraceae bacterium]